MINQNKFILAIKFKNNYIYEIATPNANGILTVQYLIEINYNNINNSTNHFDKNIFKLITQIGVEKLISFNEPIKSDNNIILKIHSINEGNIIFNFDGKTKEISFDFNKTVGELRKYFYNRINRADLIQNKNVIFMKNSTLIKQEDPISKYFNKNNKNNLIVTHIYNQNK